MLKRHMYKLIVMFLFLNIAINAQDINKTISQVNTSKNAVILFVNNKISLKEIKTIIDDRRLLGWNPIFISIDDTSENLTHLSIQLSWQNQNTWAVYYLGRPVISGSNMPTPDQLQSALESAGVPNRINELKIFLKAFPNNLDARLALMKELHNYASRKTATTLNIIPRDFRDDLSMLNGSTIAPNTEEKYLQPDDDENLWGELAAIFHKTFNSDEWQSVLPEFYNIAPQENMVIYSPKMSAIYKRNISKVEDSLIGRQFDYSLWKMWQNMAQVTGRRILDFYTEFKPIPEQSVLLWPTIPMIQWMKEEARLLKDWSKIVELQWPGWLGLEASLNMFAPVNTMPKSTPELSVQKDYFWKQQIFPLLEACLNNKDFDKATEIYFTLVSRPVFEYEAKVAFDMAKKLNYTFPQLPQQVKSVSEPEPESFLGDPVEGDRIRHKLLFNRLQDISSTGYLYLLIVSPSETDFTQQFKQVLTQGQLPEYNIFTYTVTPDNPISDELIEREGLNKNPLIWGILDTDTQYYHGGNSIPTLNSVMDVVYSMKKKSRLDIYRDFARDNPDLITAKHFLLLELQRIAIIRTINAKLDSDNLLNESADLEIWGEFIKNANAIFPQVLLRPDYIITSYDNPFKIPVANNSRLLQQFINRHIDSIENALRDRPHSTELWRLWGVFSPYIPNRSLSSFMATITPVPNLANFPPAFLYPALIENYQTLNDWNRIINLVEPIWNPLQEMVDEKVAVKHRLTKNLWEQYIEPLCIAYEKIGQNQKAERIRTAWKQSEGWN